MNKKSLLLPILLMHIYSYSMQYNILPRDLSIKLRTLVEESKRLDNGKTQIQTLRSQVRAYSSGDITLEQLQDTASAIDNEQLAELLEKIGS